MQPLRWTLAIAATVVCGGLMSAAADVGGPAPAGTRPLPAATLVEQGRYLATLGDCAACHTD